MPDRLIGPLWPSSGSMERWPNEVQWEDRVLWEVLLPHLPPQNLDLPHPWLCHRARREGGRPIWNWRKKRGEVMVVGQAKVTTRGVGVGRAPMSLAVDGRAPMNLAVVARAPVTSLTTGEVLVLANGQCKHHLSHQD